MPIASDADHAAVIFGASGGVGNALVRAVASSGLFAQVHAGMRRQTDDLPAGVRPFTFDLMDERTVAEFARGLDSPPTLIIVATGMLHDRAAGIAPEKSVRTLDPTAMARAFAINSIGPALVAKHMLPRLPKGQRAVFACLSARVGSIGDNHLGGWHSYRASKAALNMLIRNFAIEIARTHPMAIIAALHPGTVDTTLSEPFQGNVSPKKLFTPPQAAGQLLHVIDGLSAADSGGLFAWDGQRLPW